MAKKRARKKTASKKKTVKKKKSSISSRANKARTPRIRSSSKTISHRASHLGESNTEKILIENFVSLQKVMVNLSVKFDSLSSQISKLLDLFEISAKALAEKGTEMDDENKELINKLDNLLEQNKVIARGVALVHERPEVRRPQVGSPAMEIRTPIMQKPNTQPKAQNLPSPQTHALERRTMEQDEAGNQGASSKFKQLPKK